MEQWIKDEEKEMAEEELERKHQAELYKMLNKLPQLGDYRGWHDDILRGPRSERPPK